MSGRRPTHITTQSVLIGSAPSMLIVVCRTDGSWPVTLTPVRTSMPRFLNERTTTSATSGSTPGSTVGSASSTVTSVPRSDIIEANSNPMMPPPMTTAFDGSASIDSSSSEVTTSFPSMSKPGIDLGTEPVAMMTLSAVIWTSPDDPPPMPTVLLAEHHARCR